MTQARVTAQIQLTTEGEADTLARATDALQKLQAAQANYDQAADVADKTVDRLNELADGIGGL